MGQFLRYLETEQRLRGVKPSEVFRVGFLNRVYVYQFFCENEYERVMQIPGNSDVHPIAFGGSN